MSDYTNFERFLLQKSPQYKIKPMHDMQFKAWRDREWASLQFAAFMRAEKPGGLVRCRISHRSVTARPELHLYADYIQAKFPHVKGSNQGGGLRGRVSGFSDQSRVNMLRFLGRVRDLDQYQMYFLTLTYPDLFMVSWEQWKTDLDKWTKRLKRKFSYKLPGERRVYLPVAFIWRMEMKVRLSGDNAGEYAPHFHVLLWFPGMDVFTEKQLQDFRVWVSRSWSQVVNPALEVGVANWVHDHQTGENPKRRYGVEARKHRKAGTNVRVCYDRPHAMRYVSKYASKVELDEMCLGRRWGHGGDLDTSSFGVIPLREPAMWHLRRYMSRLLTGRKRSYGDGLRRVQKRQGFTVFGVGCQSRLFSSAGVDKPGSRDRWGSWIQKLLEHLLVDLSGHIMRPERIDLSF